MLRELIRFLLVGGFNTVGAYLVYLLLLELTPYLWAFTFTYFLSIFTSYVLQAKLVFKTKMILSAAIKFPLLYISLYFINAGLLYFFVNTLTISEVTAPILILVITVPISFILSRLIIKKPASQQACKNALKNRTKAVKDE